MKYVFFLVLTAVLFLGCKKNVQTTASGVYNVSQDSLVRSIQQKWKFNITISNPAVSTKLSNWEDWRSFINELTITPNATLSNISHKAATLVQKASVLKNTVPEMYNKQETKARITLLETNLQRLDMLLGLEPLNLKDITKLLTNIQKNTNSLINQFDEFEVKAKIPKEIGEDQLMQPMDTIKRATLNAIPKE